MILITGAQGQLGCAIVSFCLQKEIPYIACDKNDFDITNQQEMKEYLASYSITSIIHCAAFTDVELAQVDPLPCFQTNYIGTSNLVEYAKEINAKFIYISTDYVFDGQKNTPYEVTDIPKPISYYGLSKYLGELAVMECLYKYYIIRISWLFGQGNNFVKSMLALSTQTEISVVQDQIGSPTYAADLPPLFFELLQGDQFGIYHASNEGYCTFYDWAKKIYEIKDIPTKIIPIPSRDYPSQVQRPKNSMLSKKSLDQIGFKRLSFWENALKRYMKRIDEENNGT